MYFIWDTFVATCDQPYPSYNVGSHNFLAELRGERGAQE